jgi:HD-GYP domain-containing protein (c-di-GMP phosphodiesterase class II)
MENIQLKGEFIGAIDNLDIKVSLLASYDGTEIIHHHLTKGAYWALRPETSGTLEQVYMLSGNLRVTSALNETIILTSGDSISASPLTEYVIFQAETDVEFLYITSRPMFNRYKNMIFNLRELAVSVEQKDGYTAEHCHRILNLSMKVAEELKLTPKDQFDIRFGSFLHDLGKVRIPGFILNKPEPLSPDEWRIMKLHPVYSSDMIQETGLTFMKDIAAITLQHHERFDGSGYPLGLKGNDIHIGAAIVGVVDSFDAMTSDRIYRKALPVEEAIKEIVQNRGTLYHPHVVDAFMKIIGKESE